MFLVFNKQKIYTYMVSILTVVILFCAASKIDVISVNNTNNQSVVETSTEVQKLLPIYNVQTEENKVAFTMNCAWNADDIDQILETLKNNDTKITFFMVGDWIEKFPEAAKKINDEGHELASHSDTHPHVNNLSYDENVKEIREANKKINEITGKENNIYRAPYGEYNDTVLRSVQDEGSYCIQWSLDTLDYTGLTGDEMWDRLKNKIKAGDIILSHNGTKNTANSLDMLIKNVKAKGLEVVKVSDLIYKENYTINANGAQIKK